MPAVSPAKPAIYLDWPSPANSIVLPSGGNCVVRTDSPQPPVYMHFHPSPCTRSASLLSVVSSYLTFSPLPAVGRRLFSSALRHSCEYFPLGSEVSCDAPTFLKQTKVCQRQAVRLCTLLFCCLVGKSNKKKYAIQI